MVQYYFEHPADKDYKHIDMPSIVFPVPPYSPRYVDGKSKVDSGMTKFDMSVAEVGVPSDLLKTAIAIFQGASDDLSELLSEAAKQKLNLGDN